LTESNTRESQHRRQDLDRFQESNPHGQSPSAIHRNPVLESGFI
jgi:hypothetical protein